MRPIKNRLVESYSPVAHGHVFAVCPSSEELGLDDVMDIELDFPILSDSHYAPTSMHCLSLEVSLIV